MAGQIPEVVVTRLPIYVRVVAMVEQEETEFVSSRELATRLQMTPAQIRKDLSYFGRFGKQGRGYNVKRLLGELRQTLGLDREWSMVLIGVGRLGRAIASYSGFAPQGFKVVAAFDTDPKQIGKKIGRLVVRSIAELEPAIREHGINIGIVAVPPAQAQSAIDALVQCGVKAILNYAPIVAQVPSNVRLRHIDPVVAVQSMTFHLKSL